MASGARSKRSRCTCSQGAEMNVDPRGLLQLSLLSSLGPESVGQCCHCLHTSVNLSGDNMSRDVPPM